MRVWRRERGWCGIIISGGGKGREKYSQAGLWPRGARNPPGFTQPGVIHCRNVY